MDTPASMKMVPERLLRLRSGRANQQIQLPVCASLRIIRTFTQAIRNAAAVVVLAVAATAEEEAQAEPPVGELAAVPAEEQEAAREEGLEAEEGGSGAAVPEATEEPAAQEAKAAGPAAVVCRAAAWTAACASAPTSRSRGDRFPQSPNLRPRTSKRRRRGSNRNLAASPFSTPMI